MYKARHTGRDKGKISIKGKVLVTYNQDYCDYEGQYLSPCVVLWSHHVNQACDKYRNKFFDKHPNIERILHHSTQFLSKIIRPLAFNCTLIEYKQKQKCPWCSQ